MRKIYLGLLACLLVGCATGGQLKDMEINDINEKNYIVTYDVLFNGVVDALRTAAYRIKAQDRARGIVETFWRQPDGKMRDKMLVTIKKEAASNKVNLDYSYKLLDNSVVVGEKQLKKVYKQTFRKIADYSSQKVTFGAEYRKNMDKSAAGKRCRIVQRDDSVDKYKSTQMSGNSIDLDRDQPGVVSIQADLAKVTDRNNKSELSLDIVYHGRGWLFIEAGESLALLIDGTRVGLSGEGSVNSRHIDYGNIITETASYRINESLARRLAEAEEVKLKLTGARGFRTGSCNNANLINYYEFYNNHIKAITGRRSQNKHISINFTTKGKDMGNGNIMHADDLQSARLEVIFYATLLITFVLAWYIVRDMVLMLPGAEQFFGLGGPNTKFASAEMSTVYLVFLTAYTGYKEYRRWLQMGQDEDAASQAEVPKAEVLRFKRGEVIVFFWTLLLIVALVVRSEGLISRLPKELFRISMQAIGIWLGGLISQDTLRKRKKKRSEETAADTANAAGHGQKILEHIKANGFIDNEACQKITGLGRYQSLRLLQHLEADGTLKSQGKGKGTRYFGQDEGA